MMHFITQISSLSKRQIQHQQVQTQFFPKSITVKQMSNQLKLRVSTVRRWAFPVTFVFEIPGISREPNREWDLPEWEVSLLRASQLLGEGGEGRVEKPMVLDRVGGFKPTRKHRQQMGLLTGPAGPYNTYGFCKSILKRQFYPQSFSIFSSSLFVFFPQ